MTHDGDLTAVCRSENDVVVGDDVSVLPDDLAAADPASLRAANGYGDDSRQNVIGYGYRVAGSAR